MYTKGFYKGQTNEEIKEEIMAEGFVPVKITNSSGYVYNAHSHSETKLLAFLQGGMEVRVEESFFKCSEGDKLVIPGNKVHSAIVLSGGCVFYWAEKRVSV
ncbi:MAG: cupin domain-containing protein [Patescibacteria group bacterium]